MRENRIHMRFKQRRGQKNVKQTREVNIETVPPSLTLKVSATLKIAIFPYLRFQRFQIDMLESFLLKQKSEENIISVERYRG